MIKDLPRELLWSVFWYTSAVAGSKTLAVCTTEVNKLELKFGYMSNEFLYVTHLIKCIHKPATTTSSRSLWRRFEWCCRVLWHVPFLRQGKHYSVLLVFVLSELRCSITNTEYYRQSRSDTARTWRKLAFTECDRSYVCVLCASHLAAKSWQGRSICIMARQDLSTGTIRVVHRFNSYRSNSYRRWMEILVKWRLGGGRTKGRTRYRRVVVGSQHPAHQDSEHWTSHRIINQW